MIQKTLLLLAGTTCVALAVLATPALAKDWQCTSAKGRCPFQVVPTTKGQLQVFTDNTLPVECEELRTSRGELQKRSLDLQYKASFSACKATVAGVKHKTKVENVGGKCEIRLILKGENEGKPPKAQGTVEIKPAGCEFVIKVEGTTCEIKVPGGQGPLGKFRAEQIEVGKTREIHIAAEVEGLKAVNNEAGCGIKKEGKAMYKGRAKIEPSAEITLR